MFLIWITTKRARGVNGLAVDTGNYGGAVRTLKIAVFKTRITFVRNWTAAFGATTNITGIN